MQRLSPWPRTLQQSEFLSSDQFNGEDVIIMFLQHVGGISQPMTMCFSSVTFENCGGGGGYVLKQFRSPEMQDPNMNAVER